MCDLDTVSICAKEIQNLNHSKTLTTNLFNLRESGSLCDITLVSGGERIKCHRIILAANSKYFHAMFTSGLCETTLDEVFLSNVFIKLFVPVSEARCTNIVCFISNLQNL